MIKSEYITLLKTYLSYFNLLYKKCDNQQNIYQGRYSWKKAENNSSEMMSTVLI